MSRILRCDCCGSRLLKEFSDVGYKVTVKKLTNRYDGYAPWVAKTKLDLCNVCMYNIAEWGNRPQNKESNVAEAGELTINPTKKGQ